MPVQIGSTAHSFSDPTGLLTDCHRRIKMFMQALSAVAKNGGRELGDEERRSMDLALRYFREAAPKHTADEEESLFPLMRKLNNSDVSDALAQLDRLESDHRRAEEWHATADELGRKYLENGKLSEEDARRFEEAVSRLREMYARHIEIEDKTVFPVAAKLLPREMKEKISSEMEKRRGLKPVTIGLK